VREEEDLRKKNWQGLNLLIFGGQGESA